MQRHRHEGGTLLGILGVVLGAASAAMPQGFPPPPVGPPLSQAPVMGIADPGLVYLSAGPMWEEETVVGAPYSAEAVSESRQVLADGNVIDHKETSMIYRDSAGRVRRVTNGMGMLGMEGKVLTFGQASGQGAQHGAMVAVPADPGGPEVTVRTGQVMSGASFGAQPGFKPLSVAGPATVNMTGGKRVTIYDPVAHVTLMLDPIRKTAYKMTRPPEEMAQVRTFVQGTGSGREWNVTSQSLGARTFDGVTAYGTRTVMVIPAGAIGNEKPIKVVSDRWYSPKLQENLMTQHDDPRFGVITYKLTNIKLGEPSKALFEVPSGYTIKSFPAPPGRVERIQPPPGR
jgi:hypothetical protein